MANLDDHGSHGGARGRCYRATLGIAFGFVLVAALPGAWAQLPSVHEQASPLPASRPQVDVAVQSEQVSAEQQYFSDVVLINQYGETMRFYSDLLRGRTVVINTFFTSCTSACPVVIGKLVQIQNWLGDRLGRDVYLISITVDPEADTVQALRAYAEKVGAKRGWYFVAGAKENVDWALSRIGYFVEEKESHTNLLLLGNEQEKVWTKALGLAATPTLIQTLDEVLAEG